MRSISQPSRPRSGGCLLPVLRFCRTIRAPRPLHCVPRRPPLYASQSNWPIGGRWRHDNQHRPVRDAMPGQRNPPRSTGSSRKARVRTISPPSPQAFSRLQDRLQRFQLWVASSLPWNRRGPAKTASVGDDGRRCFLAIAASQPILDSLTIEGSVGNQLLHAIGLHNTRSSAAGCGLPPSSSPDRQVSRAVWQPPTHGWRWCSLKTYLMA